MEAALRALLIAHAPLTALVAQRIYWGALPQGVTRPAIVLYRISGAAGRHMQGSDRLTDALVQIDVQALNVNEGPQSLWAIRDVLIALLDNYRGQQGGVFFQGIFLQGERQASDELVGGGLVHLCQLDFNIWAGVTA